MTAFSPAPFYVYDATGAVRTGPQIPETPRFETRLLAWDWIEANRAKLPELVGVEDSRRAEGG